MPLEIHEFLGDADDTKLYSQSIFNSQQISQERISPQLQSSWNTLFYISTFYAYIYRYII